jgi:hypothetical protein
LPTISHRRRGDINGRQPKLTHAKALIIQTTIFDKRAYDAGLRDAMRVVIDEFTLTYPGIKHVEREYFYAVHGADDARRRSTPAGWQFAVTRLLTT